MECAMYSGAGRWAVCQCLTLPCRYLREQKGRGGDQGKTYEWGANAEDEITRAKVDEFIKQVGTLPSSVNCGCCKAPRTSPAHIEQECACAHPLLSYAPLPCRP